MLRINGLFGWIEANDRRSLMLFVGFLLSIHVAAAMALYVPLAAFDISHAPVHGWIGYLARYVPLVTVAGVAVFALRMLWHTACVRKMMAFTFVDDADEPRLCRIVENLSIGMGLPAPYVGVVPTHALNAFACGIRRRDAVVVVTRGLLDALDDDELAAVVAHELAHVANGDIRLMAAANVCLAMIGGLVRPRLKPSQRVAQVLILPFATVMAPPVLTFVLLMWGIAQAAIGAGQLVRLQISSAREYIADAAAVEATHNPAALVTALGKIAGHSRISGMPAGQDAMMIDGEAEGRRATHPTIEQRINAIVAVTGSMALNAPVGRDTRNPLQRERAKERLRLGDAWSSALGRGAAPAVMADEQPTWLGLPRELTIGAMLAVVAFLWWNAKLLDRPAALLDKLDPSPFASVMAVAGKGVGCNLWVFERSLRGASIQDEAFRNNCGVDAMREFIKAHRADAGAFGPMMDLMAEESPTFAQKNNKRPAQPGAFD
jgi:Zn-dependent protease with chaperone function